MAFYVALGCVCHFNDESPRFDTRSFGLILAFASFFLGVPIHLLIFGMSTWLKRSTLWAYVAAILFVVALCFLWRPFCWLILVMLPTAISSLIIEAVCLRGERKEMERISTEVALR